MRSIKYFPSFKTQKQIKQDNEKQQFFSKVMEKINQQFTADQNQFLINFIILQNRSKQKNMNQIASEVCTNMDRDQSPLLFIKDNVFRELSKAKNKRIITLTQDLNEKIQITNPSIAATSRKKFIPQTKYRNKKYQLKENQCSNKIRNTKDQNYLFKIYPIKKVKLNQNKSLQNILKDKSVTNKYNDNFFTELMDRSNDGIYREFGQGYLTKNYQSNVCKDFWAKQKEEQQKYKSINSIQFQRSINRVRTAIKINSRKY